MLTNPPIIPRKRNKRTARPLPASPTPTGPLEALSATVTPGAGVIVVAVVFNTTPAYPLVGVASAAAAKWTAYYENEVFVGALMQQTAYNAVTLTMAYLEPVDASNQLIYEAGPSDISDAAGRQLAAFSLAL